MKGRLTRSRSDKIFGGVLGGIASYFSFDPVWVRLGFVAFAFLVNTGAAFIAYIIALIIMPHDDNEIIVQSADETAETGETQEVKFEKPKDNSLTVLIGLSLILIGSVFLLEQLFNLEVWSHFRYYYSEIKRYVWPVILILVGGMIILKGSKRG